MLSLINTIPPTLRAKVMNEELALLYKEQFEVRKRLSQIDKQINDAENNLDEETIVKTMSKVLNGDREFVKWFKNRKEVQDYRKRKDDINNKIAKGIKLNETDSILNDTYIYALYDKEILVYIGITKNLDQRIKEHKRSKKMFNHQKILNIFGDRFHALREENKLIQKHNPKYNKQVF
jgi:predicted GIY-YIG superfamily endonuclease